MKLILPILVLTELLCGQTIAAGKKPLQIYILAGQSNMQGHVNVSTFDSLAADPKTAPILKEMRGADGKPRVCQQVWISSVGCAGDGWKDVIEQTGKVTTGFGASGEEIGPEFTFGIYMEQAFKEPILIIKTAWGGRSLNLNFRPPSAGKWAPNSYIRKKWTEMGLSVEKETEPKIKESGEFYDHMISHVKKVLGDIKRVMPEYDPKQGYELAGFVWFHGFNDLVDGWVYPEGGSPGGYDDYGQLLAHLIRDVRQDLNAPKMPFVIGVMGIDGLEAGTKPPQMYFRQAQIAPTLLPEFKSNVVAVPTAPFWDDDLGSLQARAEKKETLTPEEEKRLKASVSNGGYHYLGAAKIMAPIGKAFAEALVKLQTTQQQEKP